MTGGAAPRRAGDRFERLVKADLERHGWFVGRSAGSHGIADLIAIKISHTPLLVSCKLGGKISVAERTELADTAIRHGANAVLVSKPSRGVIGYRVIVGDDDAAER